MKTVCFRIAARPVQSGTKIFWRGAFSRWQRSLAFRLQRGVLLRHWGVTQMVEARIPLEAAQERLGHSRPDILLKFYAHVLDASADMAAETLSGQFGSRFSSLTAARLINTDS